MKRKNYFNSLISFSCAFSGPSTGAGPNSSQAVHRPVNKTDSSEKVASHARKLQQEVDQLRKKLAVSSEQREYKKCKPLLITPRIDMTKWRSLENEEKTLREENVRLQRKLNMEVERREALHRQLSESETSLEMEEERYCISKSFFFVLSSVLATSIKEHFLEPNQDDQTAHSIPVKYKTSFQTQFQHLHHQVLGQVPLRSKSHR